MAVSGHLITLRFHIEGGNSIPRNGHLNESHAGGRKGYFWTLKMEFPGFLDFGLCKGRANSQPTGGGFDQWVIFKNVISWFLGLSWLPQITGMCSIFLKGGAFQKFILLFSSFPWLLVVSSPLPKTTFPSESRIGRFRTNHAIRILLHCKVAAIFKVALKH